MQNWKKVIEYAEKKPRMQLPPNQVKALYFKGFAHVKLMEYDEGQLALEKLLTIDATHEEGKKLLEAAKKQKKTDE